MPDIIELPVSTRDDPTGEEIRAILGAHLAGERTRATRCAWVHLCAVFGALIILFPERSPTVHAFLLALWAVCTVCALVTAAVEAFWRRREARLLTMSRSRPLLPH